MRSRYTWVLLTILSLLTAAGVLIVRSWLALPYQVLRVVPPVGGTLVGPGIRCGTRGNQCVTLRPTGERTPLNADPDADYVLTAYSGDCAGDGIAKMSAERLCSATFDVRDHKGETLTISPRPRGGTLEGPGIYCGSRGAICSSIYRVGETVVFTVTADNGFLFTKLTGDCDARGFALMNTSRTCSAIFSSQDSANGTDARPSRAAQLLGLSYSDVVTEIGQPSSQVLGELHYKRGDGQILSVFVNRDRVVRVDPTDFDIRSMWLPRRLIEPQIVY